MKIRYIFLLYLCVINLLAYAQTSANENCANGIDDDGDGLIDCLDSDCVGCNLACGPIPFLNPKIFNTGNNGQGGLLPRSAKDLHWVVSNSLSGTTRAAIYAGDCVSGYWTPSPYPDAGWITDPQFGACGYVRPQNDSTIRYFSTTFELTPAVAASLKLAFDVYADNYVSEVYLNGVPQGISRNTGDVFCQGCNLAFSLNGGFQAGSNTITIKITQHPLAEFPLAQYMGFLLSASASLDSDGDGVVDGEDDCPGTPFGVTVDANGCYKLSITGNSGVCEGQTITLTAANAGSGSSYDWIPPQGGTLNGQTITIRNSTPFDGGKYKLSVTDVYGCIISDSVTISVKAPPGVSTNSISICRGNSVQLNAPPGNYYVWSPSQGLTNNRIVNPKANPTITTTYTAVVSNADGCSSTSTFLVNVNQPDSLIVSGDTTICRGGSVQLSAQGANSFRWSPAASLDYATIYNPIASPTETTLYKVVGAAVNGCVDSASVKVTVANHSQAVTLAPDFSVCRGDSVLLPVTGGINYRWFPATGLSNAAIAAPKAAPDSTINYSVIVAHGNGCIDTARTKLTVHPKPIASSIASTTICSRDTLQVSAAGGEIYTWLPDTFISNPSVANPKLFPAHTTIYTVVVATKEGCSDTTTTTVNVISKPELNLGKDTTVCASDGLTLNANIPGATSYLWNTGETQASIRAMKSGMYMVQVWISGCSSPADDSIAISLKELPQISLPTDTAICTLDTIRLQPRGYSIDEYSWNTGSKDSFLVVKSEGTYTITGSNACGEVSDNIIVRQKICADDLFFPTVFTPDGDGRNDWFKALSVGPIIIHDYELLLYNRWGVLLYRTNDLLKGWDGTINGLRQQSDVYVWQVKYRKGSESKLINRKGTVTLIR